MLRLIRKMLWLILIAMPVMAQAGLQVCNDTDDSQHIAFSYKKDDVWHSQGWWTVADDDCLTLLTEPLRDRFYYLRLRGQGAHLMHRSVKFCASEQDFKGTGSTSCNLQRLIPRDFARIDVGRGTTDATINLSDLLAQGTPTERAQADVQTLEAVFESCRPTAGSAGPLCTFVGQGQVIIARLGEDTPRTAYRNLTHMHSGAPVRMSVRVLHQYISTLEVAVLTAERRFADVAHEILTDLQGRWVSEDDPNDSFTIEGATRFSAYQDAVSLQESISVATSCQGVQVEGFALHAWSRHDPEGLCYLIEELSRDAVTLRVLKGGEPLRYRRKKAGS